MMTNPRYHRSNKSRIRCTPVTIDGHRFPSKLEAEIYTILHTYDSSVIVHPRLKLGQPRGYIHPTAGFVSSEEWKSPTWTPDFFVPRLGCYVEAKGFLTETFKLKMQFLAMMNPKLLESVIIVGSRASKWQGLLILSTWGLKQLLKTKGH